MTRLLVDEEWYDQIAPSALYEREYERVVFQQAPLLYPDYHMIPFRHMVESDYGRAKPDAVLVDKAYREWWTVEIELAHHSLANHVLPQIEILAYGYYTQDHVKRLYETNPSLDRHRLEDMMKGLPPRVLVIVNSPVPGWIQDLRRYHAIVTVFEIFRSSTNQRIFRINGECPVAPAEVISRCHFDELLGSLLIVESPAVLQAGHSERLEIAHEGFITQWIRIDSQDRVWLQPYGANPLDARLHYELLQEEDGSLLIRRIE